jgi:hypothetical protein
MRYAADAIFEPPVARSSMVAVNWTAPFASTIM